MLHLYFGAIILKGALWSFIVNKQQLYIYTVYIQCFSTDHIIWLLEAY